MACMVPKTPCDDTYSEQDEEMQQAMTIAAFMRLFQHLLQTIETMRRLTGYTSGDGYAHLLDALDHVNGVMTEENDTKQDDDHDGWGRRMRISQSMKTIRRAVCDAEAIGLFLQQYGVQNAPQTVNLFDLKVPISPIDKIIFDLVTSAPFNTNVLQAIEHATPARWVPMPTHVTIAMFQRSELSGFFRRVFMLFMFSNSDHAGASWIHFKQLALEKTGALDNDIVDEIAAFASTLVAAGLAEPELASERELVKSADRD